MRQITLSIASGIKISIFLSATSKIPEDAVTRTICFYIEDVEDNKIVWKN